jgi:RNA polymerase-binding transcription factor DksA
MTTRKKPSAWERKKREIHERMPHVRAKKAIKRKIAEKKRKLKRAARRAVFGTCYLCGQPKGFHRCKIRFSRGNAQKLSRR